MSEAVNLIRGQGTCAADWAGSQRLAATPLVAADALVPDGSHLVVVAPHPDDEVLACGGLLAQLASRAVTLHIVAVTDGEGSHPGSRLWTTQRLRATRQLESQTALERLGLLAQRVSWTRLQLPDSHVAQHEAHLLASLQRVLAGCTHVITTWRADGHCDHETVGRITAAAAEAQGVVFYEMPVWAWHWASPEDRRIPWARACRLPLDEAVLARKQAAIAAHRSQLLDDPSTGAAPILSARTLERFAHPYEVYFR